eukprot:CAMPEP_0172446214 /NCGR_PEP_ID=MMETSP1065-20121228/5864_1 /TAXON_ID=265537 /ORGANISM="Amphiprora paludosa, Strain CCMP125" /LENGTH=368 /DNA_ID=CAMNT_0013197273 /DNA_START=89 /DNA_END=1195 /DNA_ORIENTATION=+
MAGHPGANPATSSHTRINIRNSASDRAKKKKKDQDDNETTTTLTTMHSYEGEWFEHCLGRELTSSLEQGLEDLDMLLLKNAGCSSRTFTGDPQLSCTGDDSVAVTERSELTAVSQQPKKLTLTKEQQDQAAQALQRRAEEQRKLEQQLHEQQLQIQLQEQQLRQKQQQLCMKRMLLSSTTGKPGHDGPEDFRKEHSGVYVSTGNTPPRLSQRALKLLEEEEAQRRQQNEKTKKTPRKSALKQKKKPMPLSSPTSGTDLTPPRMTQRSSSSASVDPPGRIYHKDETKGILDPDDDGNTQAAKAAVDYEDHDHPPEREPDHDSSSNPEEEDLVEPREVRTPPRIGRLFQLFRRGSKKEKMGSSSPKSVLL